MNRSDLRRLARIRLREARVLLKAECYDGAYYMCGYAVECALKACIAKETKRSEFPDLQKVRDSYTHNLLALVQVANLTSLLDAAVAADATFDLYWTTAKSWSEKARYEEHGEQKARNLYRAVSDRNHGVMRWIRQYW